MSKLIIPNIWTATTWRELGELVPFDGTRHPRDWRELRRVHQRAAQLAKAADKFGGSPEAAEAFCQATQTWANVIYNVVR